MNLAVGFVDSPPMCGSDFELKTRFNPQPDGNCQFACLVDQLKYKLNVDITHVDLRHAVVKYLSSDEAISRRISNFVTEPWPQYLKAMKCLGTFGDHITLAATATLYQVQIFVLSTIKSVTLISHKCDSEFDPSVSCLFVGHFAEGRGEHYVSLEHPLSENLLEFCRKSDGLNLRSSQHEATANESVQGKQEEGASGTSVDSQPADKTCRNESSTTSIVPANDFGYVIDRVSKLSNNEKLEALEGHWLPKQKEDFPFSLHTKKGVQRRRTLLIGHLQRYKWLAVSTCSEKGGAWCSVCVLFSVSHD